MNQQGFGKIRNREGKAGVFQATVMPLSFAQNIAMNSAIPITIDGVNNKTFGVAAEVTRPVPLWNGNDFFYLRENLDYSFSTVGAATVFLDSDGVTEAAAAAVGVIYMYVGLDEDGTANIYPGTDPPSFVEGPYEAGVWSHPGTTREQFWNYVGYTVATTTVAAFAELKKRGFSYEYTTSTATAHTSATTATIDLSAFIPVHEIELSGFIASPTKAAATFQIGGATTAAYAIASSTSTGAIAQYANFSGLVPTSDGYVYGLTLTGQTDAASIRVTAVKDVV